MNATTRCNGLYIYHTFENVEFSGVLDKYKVYAYTHEYGGQPDETTTTYIRNIYDYHLFIRYGNKVYLDVKGCGDIVMTFAQLKKNKYWRHYYNLSLMLTNNKQFIMEDLQFNSNYHDPYIYDEKRVWSINTAYIEGDEAANTRVVVENEFNCYYRISPYDLENKRYATQKEIDIFTRNYMSKYEIRTKIFNKKSIHDYNLVFEYCFSQMEKELEELRAFFEDKMNVLNLATLSDKQGMNSDIIRVIYNFLVSPSSPNAHNKYKGIINNLEHYKNKLEISTSILEA
jgi:hypothetical protein